MDKKIRILSLSKSKDRKTPDYNSTIKQINQDVKLTERPNTAIVGERVQSQERLRFEKKKQREQELEMLRLEEEKEEALAREKAHQQLT